MKAQPTQMSLAVLFLLNCSNFSVNFESEKNCNIFVILWKCDKTNVLLDKPKKINFYLRNTVDNVDNFVGNSILQGIINFFVWINYFFVDNFQNYFFLADAILQRKFHHFC